MSRIFLIIGLLLTFAAGVPAAASDGNCVASGTDVLVFCDDFDGSAVDTGKWEAFANGGSVTVSGGEVSLVQGVSSRFPYMRTIGSVFPSSGPFNVTIGFRYTSVAINGDGLSVHASPPPNGTAPPPGQAAMNAWQEFPGSFRARNACGAQFTLTSPNTAAHTLSMDWAADGSSVVSLDGTSKPVCATAPRPAGVWFGHPHAAATLQWTDISIDYVRIVAPCPENGAVSSLLHSLEDEAGPAGPTVHTISCEVIAPTGL